MTSSVPDRCPRLLPGLDPETTANPFPYLATMRSTEPVYRDDEYGAYVLTRYADVEYAERHPELFSAAPAGIGPFKMPGLTTEEAVAHANQVIGVEPRTMVNADPPMHTRYRRVMSKLMTRRRVDSHEPHIRAAAHALLDQVTGSEFDLAEAYTRALPVATICRELSLPAGFEEQFLGWAALQKAAFGKPDVIGQLVALGSQGKLPNPVADFFVERIAQLRLDPRDDLLSAMIAEPLEDGRLMDDDELLSLISHFLVAGHDTTTATITNVLIALMRDQPLFTRVRDDLSLIPLLVDEALRHDAPVAGLYRLTTEDVRVGDVDIPRGSMVLLSYSAANRDPEAFPAPDAFDPFRDTSRAHLAFGTGVHFCVGAYLARLQARIGIEVAVTRLDGLRLNPPDQHFTRQSSVILRGIENLHVAVDRVRPPAHPRAADESPGTESRQT
jgi:cytochrome P450